jgi:hypothetical protein
MIAKWPDFESAHNARIDALYAENARLRAALDPFARHAHCVDQIQHTSLVLWCAQARSAICTNQQPADEPLNMVAKQKAPYPYQHRCLRLARAVLLANRGWLDRDPASIEIKMADEDSLAAAIETSVTTWLNQHEGARLALRATRPQPPPTEP